MPVGGSRSPRPLRRPRCAPSSPACSARRSPSGSRSSPGDAVAAKKPDPAIYELAVARLGARKAETLVIEDSRNGLLAATAAGLRCVITCSAYSAGEDFSEAELVLSSLGDPGDPLTVIANRSAVSPDGHVTLDELAAILR